MTTSTALTPNRVNDANILESGKPTAMLKLKDKRVALIEDNPGNVAVIATILELAGAKVGIERWGTTTFSRLHSFVPIDLILLDLMFPNGVTGFDIFRQIHNQPEFAEIPIVAVSAMDPSIAIPKVQVLGFAGFIAKPVDFDMFPTQLVKLLNNEPVWQSQFFRH
jgi:two-component system, cell cycle response regulator DivK